MKEQQQNKTEWLHIRLTEDERSKIEKQFKKTTCRKLSEYARNKLLDAQLTTYYRNQSLDDLMAELMPLRKSLNAISNNFNQAVRKLNSMQFSDSASTWLQAFERDKIRFLNEIETVKNHIQKFGEQWLQDSTPTHG